MRHEEEDLDRRVADIDEHALDRECVEQPRVFLRYALMLAEARKDLKEAEDATKVAAAECSLDIRKSPEKYGMAKATDDSVKAMTAVQKSVIDAHRREAEAEYQVNMLQAFVSALDQRKRMLEVLTTLQGQGYYAAPKVPREARERIEDRETSKAYAKATEKLNRK